MTNRILVGLVLVFGMCYSHAASTPIPQTNYTVQSFSSDNTNHPVDHAFDNDTTTWWAIYDANGFSLPGVVELDLGAFHDVNGISYLPNPANSTEKAIGYEVYLSADGMNWGTAEIIGDFQWTDLTDVSRKDIYFGAISAQFVKVVYTSSQNTSNGNIHTGDLVIYESSTPATGQINQLLTLDPVPQKYTTDVPFNLVSTINSGLPITYSVVSGPATLVGNTVTLNGTAGIVVVQVEQVGDGTYYGVIATQTFEVIDINIFYPIVSTRLTEDYPIEMPSLNSYTIYANASIEEPNLLSISSMEMEINGTVYQATDAGTHFYLMWTPPANGAYAINITATGSNGNETTITKNITVTDVVATQNVATMQDVVIEYGGVNNRWYTGTYTMPQHVGAYDQIVANLTIECPNGDCDNWDRKAYINIQAPDGNWIQIIRYITPYGVACNHQIDLTDYASLLQGEFDFKIFIDTWGTGGWQVTLDFDHQQGTPQYLYSNVTEIWDGLFDLGNPDNLQPVDTVAYTYNSSILSSHLRLSTTGHGWGSNNSQNAAEFYHAINYVDVDGVEEYTQDLWNICNPNPDNCTGQMGTWTNNRAGWCPGTIAPPNIIDMTSYVNSGTIDLTYRFDPSYIDYCHPNNPGCITGSTCPDCNDGYKAVYEVDGHMISFSDSPFVDPTNEIDIIDNSLIYDLRIYPNPSQGIFNINSSTAIEECRVFIYQVSGEVVKTYYFKNTDQLNAYLFDVSDIPGGVYFISVENNQGTGVSKIVIH
ncbi:MAG: hypothetical protein COA38_13375 [Fluviicola sp.]|nr:MAG: hypothetical protein COA38_13375 [Fluviicola sp.]